MRQSTPPPAPAPVFRVSQWTIEARAPPSELQRRDVRVVAPEAVHRSARIRLLFDEEKLLVDVLDARHQPPEIDDAFPELRVARRANARDILDVEGPVARAVSPHVLERILSSHGGIPGVELMTHQRCIRPLDEHVVRHHAAYRRHVVPMIVEPDPGAAGPGATAGFVKSVGPKTIVVERARSRNRKTGNDEILVPERLRFIQVALEIIDDASADMRRWRAESVAVEYGTQLSVRHSEVVHRPEHLDVLVPDRGDVGEGPLEVASCVVAKTVELNADALQTSAADCGARGISGAAELRSRSGESDRSEKCAPMHEG